MTRARLLLPAELALTFVSVAAVGGFARLFLDFSFFPQVGAAAVLAHALAAALRRRGWGLGWSTVGMSAGLVLAVTWLLYPGTSFLAAPSGATAEALSSDTSDAWTLFQDVVAPAPVEPGFVLALVIGIWASVFLADWAAFRLWSAVEAVVPAAALFVFGALLGADQHRVSVTGWFLLATFGFLLLHRVARDAAGRSWVNADEGRGSRSLIAAGSALSALAVGLAVVVGPAIPGAEAEGLLTWRDIGDGPGSRVTLSPMVDIRSRLVDQTDVELFTVRSPVPAYWRLTALDDFDGQIWKSRGDYEGVDEDLDSTVASGTTSDHVEQLVTVRALAALWLPAAFEPRRLEVEGADVVFEPASSTLIVGEELDDSDGISYLVESAMPSFEPAALAASVGPLPPEISERYLTLPVGFSPAATEEAQRIVAGATTPYEQALLLQNWFRGEFTYDLAVDAGHGVDSIDTFLRDRRGYCEQFSGTYAAMARSLGIPSRVAVGFTPGEQDPADPTLFHVTGRQAHAWPEVYLGGAGWVAFEPTPGRGAPGAQNYTGVEPQQDAGAPITDPISASSTTVDPTAPLTSPTLSVPEQQQPTVATTGDATTRGSGIAGWISAVGRLALAVVFLGAAYSLTVIVLRGVRERRRLDRARSPRARTLLAWELTGERLASAGVAPRPEETRGEYATRVAESTDLDCRDLSELADVATAADYAVDFDDAAAADDAHRRLARIGAWADDHTAFATRVRETLDPRPLVPSHRSLIVRTRG